MNPRLFLQELRKILRPLPLLILAAFTALYAYVFMVSPYDYLNTYHSSSDNIRVAAKLKEIVGEPVTPENLSAGIATLRAQVEAEIIESIESHRDILAPLGVTDYESFRTLESKILYSQLPEEQIEALASGRTSYGGAYDPYDPAKDYTLTPQERAYAGLDISGAVAESPAVVDTSAAQGASAASDSPGASGTSGASTASDSPGAADTADTVAENPAVVIQIPDDRGGFFLGNAGYEIDIIDNTFINGQSDFEEFVEQFDTGGIFAGTPEAGLAHIGEILHSEESMNILPTQGFFSHTGQVFMFLTVLILLTVCILLAPVVTRDNMTGVRALQYSSKAGRRALRVQLCAMMTSALVVAVIEIAVTFAVFLRGAWGSFLDSGLHTLFNHFSFSWFTGTFGQWLFCCALLILAVNLAAALLVFVISKISKNYITLLLGLIPAMAALVFFCTQLFIQPFAILSDSDTTPYALLPIPFVEAYLCGGLLVLGVVAVLIMLKRQQKAEIA